MGGALVALSLILANGQLEGGGQMYRLVVVPVSLHCEWGKNVPGEDVRGSISAG